MPVILTVVASGMRASARPAVVFIPHMEDMQRNLPVGLAMRLPDRIVLSEPSDIEEDQLVVRFFSLKQSPKLYGKLIYLPSLSSTLLIG